MSQQFTAGADIRMGDLVTLDDRGMLVPINSEPEWLTGCPSCGLSSGCDCYELEPEIEFVGPGKAKFDSLIAEGFQIVGHALEGKDSRRCWINKYGVVLWPRLEQEAQAEREKIATARWALEQSVDALAYAAFNIDGSKLEDLPPGLIESTSPSETALIAERCAREALAALGDAQPASAQAVRIADLEADRDKWRTLAENAAHNLKVASEVHAAEKEALSHRIQMLTDPIVRQKMLEPSPPIFIQAPDVAKAIHYPECWDTACYPTVAEALLAIGAFRCTNDDCAQAEAQRLQIEAMAIRDAIDAGAIAWAYQKLLAFGVGTISMEDAMMLDRLNDMLRVSAEVTAETQAQSPIAGDTQGADSEGGEA